MDRLKQPSGLNYFDIYNAESSYSLKSVLRTSNVNEKLPSRELYTRSLEDLRSGVPVDLYLYFGVNFTDVLRLANRKDSVEIPNDNIDTQVYEFTKEFDDNQLR